MEGIALLLCEQRGGREGWRSDELVRSQGQVPTGDGVLEGQVPGRDVSEGQVLGIEITLIWFQPDEILRSLKLFPAGLAALLLPSPQALRPRPSDQCADFGF